jgi:hypothetical protein
MVGRLVDITPDGIRLVSEHEISVDTIFELRLILPEGFADGEYLDFEAKSVWCKRSANPSLFETGFLLINDSATQIKIIEDLIADIGFSEY